MNTFGILTTFLYLCCIAKAQTEDIKITDLNKVPGLLPVSLGTAKLHDFYKTKIHKIDLSLIEGPLQELDKTWYSISGFMGHEFQLEYLDEKRKNVRKRLENLNQFNTRSKRWIGLATSALGFGTALINKVFNKPKRMDTSMYDAVIRKLEGHDQQIRQQNQAISWFSQKNQETNSRVDVLEKNHDDVVRKQKDHDQQIRQQNQEILLFSQKNQRTNSRVDVLEKNHDDVVRKLEDHDQQIIHQNQEISLFGQKNQETNDRIDILKKNHDDVVKKQEDHDQQIRHQNEEISLFNQKIQKTNSKVDMLEKNHHDVVKKLEVHDRQIRHQNQEISLFSQKIQETNHRVDMLEKNQRDLNNFVVELQKDVEVQFEQVGQRINTLQQKHDNLQITVNNVQSVLAGVRNNLTLYIQTKQMLDYFENQVNMLNDLIQDVENAFTFAKLGIAHPSLFTSDQLFGMLKDLNVDDDQLLFPMSMKNINSFHSILDIRAYKSGSNLVFLISIPIMKKEQYDYYQLVSVPVKRDSTYIHIEPKKPYLLVNDRKFILSDTPCFDREGMYYCQNYNDFATRNQMSCLEEIVMLEDDYSKCEFETSNFKETEVFPISNEYYIAVNADQEKFKMYCRTRKVEQLQGTQLIYLPEGCSFTWGNSMYMNNEIDMQKFTPIIPHSIDWSKVQPNIKENVPMYRRLTSGSNIININNFIMLLATFLFLIY